mmetsp:Transcript_15389/g.26007  ORF Transcript_15389/g.26007 Transcript_15389/m.26007 type:complete len:135 (+) Transcript_15389:1-405(+)
MRFKKKLAKLFQKQSNLAAIINKSRLFNTYLSIFEFFALIYYNVVPSRTNQGSTIFNMNMHVILSILACMNIHLAPKLSNFTNSVQLNVLMHFFLVTQTQKIYNLFLALQLSCQLVWDYYEKKGQRSVFINIQG